MSSSLCGLQPQEEVPLWGGLGSHLVFPSGGGPCCLLCLPLHCARKPLSCDVMLSSSMLQPLALSLLHPWPRSAPMCDVHLPPASKDRLSPPLPRSSHAPCRVSQWTLKYGFTQLKWPAGTALLAGCCLPFDLCSLLELATAPDFSLEFFPCLLLNTRSNCLLS